MPERSKSFTSFSTLQILGAVVFLLGACVVLALVLAPDKPEAPPRSVTTYNDHPDSKDANDALESEPWRPRRNAPKSERRSDAALASDKTTDESAPYSILGTVTEGKTSEPLASVSITAQRLWTPEEESDWENRRREARRDPEKIQALMQERQEKTEVVARGQSKDDGSFEIPVKVAGRYRVDARLKTYVDEQQDVGPLDDQNKRAEIAFTLATGATIQGRVIEEGTTQGAPGVRVFLEENPRSEGTTDDKGQFEITGIRPGDYGVTANLAGTEYRPGKELPYRKVKILTADQVISNIQFAVEAAGVVWGYIMTPDKKPVSSAEVILSSNESALSQLLTAQITRTPPVRGSSNAEGYYELLGVPLNKEWRVYATSDKHTPQLADAFILSPKNRSVQIDVFLFGGSLITGRVVDTDRKPVPDAEVTLLPAFSKLVAPSDSALAFRNTRSDQDGMFALEEIPMGDYQIMGRKRGYKFSAAGEPIYPDGVDELRNVEVTLFPMGEGDNAIYGVVVDMANEPVASAHVRASGFGSDSLDSLALESDSDSSGNFRIDGIEAGMYSLTVSKEGFAPRTVPRAMLNQPITVVLNTAAMVRGQVLVKETNAPPGPDIAYLISARPVSGGASRAALQSMSGGGEQRFMNADGSYEIALPAGDWLIEGKVPGMTPGRANVSVLPGDITDGVNLIVSSSGGTISGTVRTLDGKSPNGTTVTLAELSVGEASDLLGGGGALSPETVGDDGAFSFEQLPEGVFTVVAQNPAYANSSSGAIELALGETRDDIELRLGSGGIIEGKVYRRGKPLSGANVLVANAEAAVGKQATTDDSGYFVIDGLASGQYEVTAFLATTGNISDALDRQGTTANVVEGETTLVNFGLEGGTRVTGYTSPPPPPPIGGEIFLRPPGSMPGANVGESLSQNSVQGIPSIQHTGISFAGNFEFEPVPPGFYQVEIYYIVNGMSNAEFRCVYIGVVEIPAEDEIQLPIQVNLG